MLLDAALEYAAIGWPVFPLRPGGKTPATSHSFKDATVDPDQIRRWWEANPAYNIGIACGPAGLVVIDVDARDLDHNGWTQWCDLVWREAPDGLEPLTFEVATPTGGGHFYYRAPPGDPVGNSAGRLAPNVDVRANGGYVVAPPSVTPAGIYETDPARPLLPCPDWLTALLRPPKPPRTATAPSTSRGRTAYGTAALDAETAAVSAAPEGTRNHRLNQAAFSLGQLVAAGDLRAIDVAAALFDAALACGLGESEAEATITSGLLAGTRNPRAAS